jgi:hypothetical protein
LTPRNNGPSSAPRTASQASRARTGQVAGVDP